MRSHHPGRRRPQHRTPRFSGHRPPCHRIVEIKGIVKCPNCGAENSKTAAFCATCGTAMPVPVTEPVEVTEQNVVEKKCPNCGEVINDGAAFCAKCGTKIEGEK